MIKMNKETRNYIEQLKSEYYILKHEYDKDEKNRSNITKMNEIKAEVTSLINKHK